MAKPTREITQANFTLLRDETFVGLMLGLLFDVLLAVVSCITSTRDLNHCPLGRYERWLLPSSLGTEGRPSRSLTGRLPDLAVLHVEHFS